MTSIFVTVYLMIACAFTFGAGTSDAIENDNDNLEVASIVFMALLWPLSLFLALGAGMRKPVQELTPDLKDDELDLHV